MSRHTSPCDQRPAQTLARSSSSRGILNAWARIFSLVIAKIAN